MKTVLFGAVFAVTQIFAQWVLGFGSTENNSLCYPFISYSYHKALEKPMANNDTVRIAVGCGSDMFSGNVMTNDVYEPETAWLSYMEKSDAGSLSYDAFGNFSFIPRRNFRGELNIRYKLSAIDNGEIYSEGVLTLFVLNDFDCDGVVDEIDLDDDNDGIIDFHEGHIYTDTDGDQIPNYQDIDSDNDGITDFTEWQRESSEIRLLLCDENGDGWDDAFDPACGGEYYEQVDSDDDGTPDFLDSDSDNDGISDFEEAFGTDELKDAQLILSNLDYDQDGLDNFCDTIIRVTSPLNPIGSKSPLPDSDNNGIRDWRDPDQNVIDTELSNALGQEVMLRIYPNPVVDHCKLILPASLPAEAFPFSLSISSLRGELVHLELLYQYHTKLNLQALKRGVYVVRIEAGGKMLSTKFTKFGL